MHQSMFKQWYTYNGSEIRSPCFLKSNTEAVASWLQVKTRPPLLPGGLSGPKTKWHIYLPAASIMQKSFVSSLPTYLGSRSAARGTVLTSACNLTGYIKSTFFAYISISPLLFTWKRGRYSSTLIRFNYIIIFLKTYSLPIRRLPCL